LKDAKNHTDEKTICKLIAQGLYMFRYPWYSIDPFSNMVLSVFLPEIIGDDLGHNLEYYDLEEPNNMGEQTDITLINKDNGNKVYVEVEHKKTNIAGLLKITEDNGKLSKRSFKELVEGSNNLVLPYKEIWEELVKNYLIHFYSFYHDKDELSRINSYLSYKEWEENCLKQSPLK